MTTIPFPVLEALVADGWIPRYTMERIEVAQCLQSDLTSKEVLIPLHP